MSFADILVEHVRAARQRRPYGIKLVVPVATQEHGDVALEVPHGVDDADLPAHVEAWLEGLGEENIK